MKYLKNTLPLLLALLMVTVTVQAQQIDANRLNRDIKIMENILSEMFRLRPVSSGNGTSSFAYTASRSGSSDIRGTYLPDYGVIFQIPKPTNFSVVFSGGDAEEAGFSFYYGDDDSGENTISKEGITDRIVEFLRDYGSTMGQLSGDDRIMVIYGGAQRSRSFGTIVVNGSRSSNREATDLPIISVSATMSDLNASRSGSLSEQQFRSRVSVSESEANSNRNMDLRVMANIIETAFGGGEEDRFRVRGSVDYLQLDNFGALFYFDARYGSGSYTIRVVEPFEVYSGSRDTTASSARGRAVLEETRARLAQVQEENEERREEQARVTKAAFETFKQELKEYLVDYGRTLGSVEADQFILLSVTLNSSVDEIPDRLDVQIAKSVLRQLDQGQTSREQALDQVSLREY